MTMAERIKELRLSANLTQEELGEKLGLQKSAVAKYENGRVENIKQSTIMAMANLFKVRPSYIMGWDDTPLYESAAGEGIPYSGYPTETASFGLRDEEVAVKVKGRSMEPTLLDGDTVVVSAQNTIDYPRQICLVRVNGDESTIKRVEIKQDGILLIGDNTDVYPPHFFTRFEAEQMPVRIEGVVTRLIRDIR